jgi:hypothetical protein
MWIWWVIVVLALLLAAAALHDRWREHRSRPPLPPDLRRAERQEAKRIYRAERTARRRASVGYGGFGDGGGHVAGFDGGHFGGFDCGGGGGDGGGC